ncbi:MAG: CDP-alcohol phosphatidyltransferase family protein [Patescibacteria group bacterium]|mgnify:FL=1
MSFDAPNKTTRRPLTFVDRMLNYDEARVAYYARPTPIDHLMEKTLLPFIPATVTPNEITLFRFACIPFVIFFLAFEYYVAGTILFSVAALSDALDGALARTTKRITSWGTLFDPFADKLLVGSAVLLLVVKLINPFLALAIVGIELTLILSSYIRFKGRVVPAKTVGKVKMVLQCAGIIFLLLHVLSGAIILLTIATYTLYLALAFALLSLFVYRSV